MMKTILILNTIGLLILFAICTVFFIMLIKCFKHINVLENKKIKAEERAEYHVKALKIRAGVDDSKGYDMCKGDKL